MGTPYWLQRLLTEPDSSRANELQEDSVTGASSALDGYFRHVDGLIHSNLGFSDFRFSILGQHESLHSMQMYGTTWGFACTLLASLEVTYFAGMIEENPSLARDVLAKGFPAWMTLQHSSLLTDAGKDQLLRCRGAGALLRLLYGTKGFDNPGWYRFAKVGWSLLWDSRHYTTSGRRTVSEMKEFPFPSTAPAIDGGESLLPDHLLEGAAFVAERLNLALLIDSGRASDHAAVVDIRTNHGVMANSPLYSSALRFWRQSLGLSLNVSAIDIRTDRAFLAAVDHSLNGPLCGALLPEGKIPNLDDTIPVLRFVRLCRAVDRGLATHLRRCSDDEIWQWVEVLAQRAGLGSPMPMFARAKSLLDAEPAHLGVINFLASARELQDRGPNILAQAMSMMRNFRASYAERRFSQLLVLLGLRDSAPTSLNAGFVDEYYSACERMGVVPHVAMTSFVVCPSHVAQFQLDSTATLSFWISWRVLQDLLYDRGPRRIDHYVDFSNVLDPIRFAPGVNATLKLNIFGKSGDVA